MENMSKKSKYLRFLQNSSSNTFRAYSSTIKKYEEYHGTSIERLVEEALLEQSNNTPLHLLKIIDRIEDFQNHLINEQLTVRTISTIITRIKSVYHKNRVNIPYIEPINPKQINKRDYIEYKDILTEDEIRSSLKHMRPPAQAKTYAMVQGGLSNEETTHLLTRSFIDENYKYHQCDDDIKALKWLADENHPIIWVTKLIRVKTGKPYYAIMGGESVNKIAESLLYVMRLPKSDGELPTHIFPTSKVLFNRTCGNVNDKLGFGTIGDIKYTNTTDEDGNIYINKKLFKKFQMITDISYSIIKEKDKVIISTDYPNTTIEYLMGGKNKLSPHQLRKFHATHIRGSALTYEEHSRISYADIDEMQGRGKTNVQDTYIKTNPLEQKLLYAKVMNNVSLYHQYDYEITDEDVLIFIRNLNDENKKLKDEVKILNKKLEKKKKASEKVNALRNELGEEGFKELIGEILNAK